MSASEPVPILEMCDISKSFPGVRALDRVTFDVRRGEIHALVGENGAGKSTLMKVLGGVHPRGSFEGEIRIDGRPCNFTSVRDAEAAGIALVHQELSLVPDLSVAENILLGREPHSFGILDHEALMSRARAVLSELRLSIAPDVLLGHLGIGQQHLVEIAKALAREARILVLDEPTAALAEEEAEILFGILERLRASGVAIVYISHKLGEVFHLANRITVLRDGRTVSTDPTGALDTAQVIARMVGREISDIFPVYERHAGEVVFEAHGVTVSDPNVPTKLLVREAGFSVRRGEVLGIAGLLGAGRTDLLMAAFGAHRGRRSGEFYVDGARVEIRRPADAIAHGIALVSEDRKREGLMLDQSVVDNMTLPRIALARRAMADEDADTAAAEREVRELRIRTSSVFVPVGTLSGGNQQKVVLGKWLLTGPRVLLLDEPTRGIDVGARQEIYRLITSLAEDGMAIVLVSSELPEVVGLSDRVLVLHEGEVTGEFTRAEATAEAIMACATGHRRMSMEHREGTG